MGQELARDATGATALTAILREKIVAMWWPPPQTSTIEQEMFSRLLLKLLLNLLLLLFLLRILTFLVSPPLPLHHRRTKKTKMEWKEEIKSGDEIIAFLPKELQESRKELQESQQVIMKLREAAAAPQEATTASAANTVTFLTPGLVYEVYRNQSRNFCRRP